MKDATTTVGVDFVVEDAGADEGGLFVLVSADGMGDGFRFDRQGRGDGSALRSLECFEVLQETVHEVLARRGRFGPWPACPAQGHAHKLTTTWRSETSQAWWACPDDGPVVPVGELPSS